MIDALIFLNLLLSFFCGLGSVKDMETFAGAVLYFMHAIFFVVMPFLGYHYGFSAYGNIQQNGVIEKYLLSGAVGIFSIYVASKFVLMVRVPSKILILGEYISRVADSTRRSYWAALCFFVVGLYMATAIKYESFAYIAENIDAFSLAMSRVNGSYFLNVASSVFIYFGIFFLYIYGRRKGKIRYSNFFFVALMYVVLAKPSTRSWALILLLSIIAFNGYKRNLINVKTIIPLAVAAPVAVVLLNILNQLRLGRASALNVGEIIKDSFSSLYINFLQFENALLLIDKYNDHSYENFHFLLNSINPLNLVPRALWLFDKPRADKDAYLTEIIFGGRLDSTFYSDNSTLTYTIPISGYADHGVMGVIISCAGFGLIVGMAGKLIKKFSGVVRILALYFLISISAGYRLSLETAILNAYIAIVATLGFLLFFRRYKLI